MTEIYLHFYSRITDYMETHPYSVSTDLVRASPTDDVAGVEFFPPDRFDAKQWGIA